LVWSSQLPVFDSASKEYGSETLVDRLLKHAQQLLEAGGQPAKALTPEAEAAWQRVTGSVAQLEQLWLQNSSKENGIFLLLFCQIGLQLFSQPEMAVDVLSELEPVYENWNKKKAVKGNFITGIGSFVWKASTVLLLSVFRIRLDPDLIGRILTFGIESGSKAKILTY
jgi:DNA polymerase phi